MLGRVEVSCGGQVIELRGRLRLLLAVLVLADNAPVAMEYLIDLIWPDGAPASARNAVQVMVSHLRQRLRLPDDDEPIVSTGGGSGYLLRCKPEETDLGLFQQDVALAKESDDESAVVSLRRGLGLWRGAALADIGPEQLRQRLARGLDEARWTAWEDCFDAELRLGHAAAVVPELAWMIQEHPGRERLVGQFMLALHRSGRTAEALAAYRQCRAWLGTETGLEPSPALRDLSVAIARGDRTLDGPTPPVRLAARAATFPATVESFLARDAELARLDAIHAAGASLAVIHGMAGVGKTALAIAWANRHAASFPDGRHYVDLRGASGQDTISLDVACAQVSAAVADPGSDSAAQQANPDELRRSVTGRRLLILDNVPDSSYVRQLRPEHPTVMVIAISRQAQDALMVHAQAKQLKLEPLAEQDAVALLARLSGWEDRKDSRLRTVARLCDGLPLALRIAGCRIATDPDRELSSLSADLSIEERRLETLALDEHDGGVRMAFALTYERIDPAAADVFRQLGCFPGESVSVHAAAVLTQSSTALAYRALLALARSHLVYRDGLGHYRMHDLVRIFARERCDAELAASARDDALARLTDWCLHASMQAYTLISPRPPRIDATLEVEPQWRLSFGTKQDALAWFEAECTNLSMLVRHLHSRAWHRRAWQIALSLFAFYHRRRRWVDWVDTYGIALMSARADGDSSGESRILNGLGVANKQLGRFEAAVGYYEAALVPGRIDNNPFLLGPVHVNLAGVYNTLGKTEQARRHLEAARDIPAFRADTRYAPVLFLNLGHLNLLEGRLEEALADFHTGLAAAEEIGDSHTRAYLEHGLADVALRRDAYRDADDHATRALQLARSFDDPLREVYSLDLLASIRAAQFDDAQAVELWLQARGRAAELGHPLAADIDEVLTALGDWGEKRVTELIMRRDRVNRMP